MLNAVYDALINSSCIWICCDCGLPSFSRSFFDSCIEVQTRHFSRLLTTVVLIIPPLLTAQMPKLRLASDFPCRRPALLLRFQIREQGTSRGRQVGFKTPLTQEPREPSSSNDSDNDQSSPSTSLPHAVICDINLRANPPANPKRNFYLYKRADMEGLRRKLKERFEQFEASRPETKFIRENWD